MQLNYLVPRPDQTIFASLVEIASLQRRSVWLAFSQELVETLNNYRIINDREVLKENRNVPIR